MTSPPATYSCRDDLRAEAVLDATTVNGIDFLEVRPNQTKLEVHFLHPLPGQSGGVPVGGTTLNRTHLAIEGGDRVRDIRVRSTATSGAVLTVVVSGPGDFSTYRLRLVDPVSGGTPSGFDPRTSQIDFSFKAGCPIRFDCAPAPDCPPEPDTSQVRDYLAKDYESFRQLMLDRMATTIPDWRERNPADLQIALVELLAFAADRLSEEQDAVATEAYLGTARSRVSVRRHARLLGYRMHEGSAARAFVQVQVGGTVPIAQGQQFLTGDDDSTLVFEALHDLTASPTRNDIPLYTWTDEQCCLPRGATRATLAGEAADLGLGPGDYLLLEEVAGVASGEPVDADRSHRHVVRLTDVTAATDPLDGTDVVEVAWAAEDALPFPFCITALTTSPEGVRQHSTCGVARGNVVLVEHGERMSEPVLLSKAVDVAGRWRPGLPDGRPTYAVPHDPTLAASRLLDLDPRRARAAVTVSDGDRDYDVTGFDLLGSAPNAADFVVETEEDGSALLRFGDGSYGRRPDPDLDHLATYRRGHGAIGNVGAESITRLRSSDPALLGVRNPLPAGGGTDPEPTDKVRTDAPHAFRVQERAVTEADYGTVLTERFPGVQRAAGRMRWTGSWYTAFVTVDRVAGLDVNRAFRTSVQDFLDTYRMAGVDVEVSPPEPVPLEIGLDVCAHTDRFATDVERDVLDALSSRVLRDGRRGLFHPDHFTFGTPVYLSRVYAAALAIAGVETVRASTFRRYGEPDRGELAAGVIRVHDLEIAQLANDPDVPERGILTVTVAGGR